MRLSVPGCLAWLIAVDLLLPASASLAQQAPGTTAATSTARRGYFTRVQTQTTAGAPARGARYGGRLDAATAVAGRGASRDDRFRNELDPLRPYGEPVQSTSLTRPYEQAPTVSPRERELPAPPVSHNYFPGMRPGQGPNRNVVPHCVPGRHAFLHR
jgi:hypothetical protein